jgi:hypothetical protein
LVDTPEYRCITRAWQAGFCRYFLFFWISGLILGRGHLAEKRLTVALRREKIALTESEAKGEMRIAQTSDQPVKIGVVKLQIFYDDVETATGAMMSAGKSSA